EARLDRSAVDHNVKDPLACAAQVDFGELQVHRIRSVRHGETVLQRACRVPLRLIERRRSCIADGGATEIREATGVPGVCCPATSRGIDQRASSGIYANWSKC